MTQKDDKMTELLRRAWIKGSTPRDPKRIDRIIELLRETWRLSPDLRLTQLVVNVARTGQPCPALFYLEDTEIEKALEAFMRECKEQPEHSENEKNG